MSKLPDGALPFNLKQNVAADRTMSTKTGDLGMNDEVILFGMASGVTAGFFSYIDSTVHLQGLDKPPTTECVVVGYGSHHFCNYGDSGAFVLDTDGLLVGMLIGGSLGPGLNGNGYVTRIGEVFADIEAQTGMKVALTSISS